MIFKNYSFLFYFFFVKKEVFSHALSDISDILLRKRNSCFYIVKHIIYPNDGISLIKFDYLVFTSRLGQGLYLLSVRKG